MKRARRILGTLVPALSADRRDPAGDFVSAGLFDLAYYQAQLPVGERPSTLVEAQRHYVSVGRSAGLAMHPFIEPEWWDPQASTPTEDAVGRERGLIHGGQHGSSTSSLISEPIEPIGITRDYLQALAIGELRARIPGGLTPAQAARKLTTLVDVAMRRAPNVGTASNVDWATLAAELPNRVAGRTSILIPTYEDWRMTVDSARAALHGAAEVDLEVVIVDNGSRLAVFRNLAAVFLEEPRVRIVRCSVNTNFAGGMNRAIAESTGEHIVLLNNDAVLAPGWLTPLVAALADPTVRGAQPLLLYPRTNRVQAAGTMFLGEGVLPWHFLAGHPREDVDRMTNTSFKAVTAAVLALRASDIVAATGFDEEFENGYEDVDLCLRLLRDDRDRFVLVRESVAEHPEGSSPGRSARDSENRRRFFRRWAGKLPAAEPGRYLDIGMRLTGMLPLWFSPEVPILITDPQLQRVRTLVSASSTNHVLRWLLLTDGVDGSDIDGMKSVLAELGQEVVTVLGGVHSSDALADVVLAFSNEAQAFPRAGSFNVVRDGRDSGAWHAVTDGTAGDLQRIIDEFRDWERSTYPEAPE